MESTHQQRAPWELPAQPAADYTPVSPANPQEQNHAPEINNDHSRNLLVGSEKLNLYIAKDCVLYKRYITIQENDTLELIYKTERLKDTENKPIVTKGAKGEG